MSDTLRRAEELVEAGLIAPEREAEIAAVAERYAVAITRDVAALINPADAADPIARQFIPDGRELATAAEELADPIG
ncbi:MAG TPA: lysine 2,3-aminomutase, partial [Stellaceae bacterium]